MPLTITDYTPSDYEDVWALHQQTIRGNDGFVKNLSFHTDIHDIPHVYEAFFVLRDGGPIIGMVGLKRIDKNTLEVKRLQVAAAHQGKGLGRLLMERAIDYARTHGIARIILDVSEPQASARSLYLSMGFKATHVGEQILGPDNEKFLSTYMEKEL